MRLKLFYLVLLVGTNTMLGQVTGDYRTTGNASLNSNNNWQVFNGSTWVAATTAPYSTTFLASNTLTILASNHTVSSNADGSIAPANLVVNGTLNVGHIVNTGPITINGNSGKVTLSNTKRLNVQGNMIVNPGGEFTVGNGNTDSAILVVYGNYTNDGNTKFGMAEVYIVGNLLSNTASQVQNNGNLIVGGNIIGVFINQGNGGQFYFLDPNATINITIQPGGTANPINGYPGTYEPTVFEVFGNCLATLTTTWNGSSWSRGIPTLATTAILTGAYNGASFNACQMTVTSSGSLTISNGNYVNVRHGIENLGTIVVENGGTLNQVADNGTYTGNNITAIRTTRAMKGLDYVYWGSPMQENVFSQIPSDFDLKYKWVLNGTINGTWTNLTATSPAEGFITRVKNIAPYNAPGGGTLTFTYLGKPNNGVKNVTVNAYDGGSMVSGNTVLLANPYPSAIDAARFVRNANNTSKGIGTLYFWTSNTLYTGGQYAQSDYASWNLTGSTTTTSTPLESLRPNGKIASGQGFFAQVFADGAITFNNSMRILEQNTSTTVFYRTAENENSIETEGGVSYVYPEPEPEAHRIWINIKGTASTAFRQMLVGYIDGATNGFERTYDGTSFSNSPIDLYSILENNNLTIQGKALPFAATDVIPLGYKVGTQGTYTLELDEVVGLFTGTQEVFIKDNLTQTYHNLKEGVYTFISDAGTFNSRFELRFINETLSTNNPSITENDVVIYGANGSLHVNSKEETIQTIELYDVLGRRILVVPTVLSNEYVSGSLNNGSPFLIAKVTLVNNQVVTKKVLIK